MLHSVFYDIFSICISLFNQLTSSQCFSANTPRIFLLPFIVFRIFLANIDNYINQPTLSLSLRAGTPCWLLWPFMAVCTSLANFLSQSSWVSSSELLLVVAVFELERPRSRERRPPLEGSLLEDWGQGINWYQLLV